MKELAIILLVAHYVLPVLCFVVKKLPYSFEIAAGSYILSFIGLWVMVCMMPDYMVLRVWLIISTAICWIIGIFSVPEHNYQGSPQPGCLLLFPGIVGAVIIMWVL